DDWLKNGIPYSDLEGAGYLSSNVTVANGTLNLSTSSRAAAGFNQSTGSVNTNKKFAFQYGYIEARILVPACAGCWPAFWMLPSADHWPPEIDIIEFFDTSKQVIPYSAVHWPVAGAAKEQYFSQRLQTSDADNYIGTWHTYAMLWTRDLVQFYVDGNLGPQFNVPGQIPHLPMYPILQLAVGAGHRPSAGSTMQVDHVRAWQRAD
ncbi:MAG: glycoside hydrolase family 16 protein, partial [Solirubrobacterales bacterium]